MFVCLIACLLDVWLVGGWIGRLFVFDCDAFRADIDFNDIQKAKEQEEQELQGRREPCWISARLAVSLQVFRLFASGLNAEIVFHWGNILLEGIFFEGKPTGEQPF